MSTLQEHSERQRRADILHRFDTFDITPAQGNALAATRNTFRDMAEYILNWTKPGREQSLALTALEEAKYWTNQAIAKDGVPE